MPVMQTIIAGSINKKVYIKLTFRIVYYVKIIYNEFMKGPGKDL